MKLKVIDTSPDEIKYQTKNPFKRYLLNRFLNKITSIISNTEFDNLLDAGCGQGYVIHYLDKKHVRVGKSVIGIDLWENKLQKARKLNPKMIFEKGDIYDLKFPSHKFDLVICLEVLEHLNNPIKAIKELYRVAKKNLIISVPNEPLYTILRFLSIHDFWKLGRLEEHINHWTIKKFDLLLKNLHPNNYKIYKSAPWLIAVIDKK